MKRTIGCCYPVLKVRNNVQNMFKRIGTECKPNYFPNKTERLVCLATPNVILWLFLFRLVKSLKFRFEIFVYCCCCARTVYSASQFACNAIHPEIEKEMNRNGFIDWKEMFLRFNNVKLTGVENYFVNVDGTRNIKEHFYE